MPARRSHAAQHSTLGAARILLFRIWMVLDVEFGGRTKDAAPRKTICIG
ncbi:hypothetical protein [Paenibacillus ihumii]|nr:hypothetical protein [Paenibacillus ihumii]